MIIDVEVAINFLLKVLIVYGAFGLGIIYAEFKNRKNWK
jgi:hypothetical protein